MKEINLQKWESNKHRLLFDEDKHIYYWDNVPIQTSMTSVIKSLGPDYGEIDPAILEAAGIRGTMVHKWIEDHFNNVPLPWRQMLASYQPYIDAFINWTKDYGERYEMLYSELKLYSPTLKIAGTIDAIVHDKYLDKLCILDFKTNSAPIEEMVTGQIGGYATLLEEWMDEKIEMGLVLYMSKLGVYNFKQVDLNHGKKSFNNCYKQFMKGKTIMDKTQIDKV